MKRTSTALMVGLSLAVLAALAVAVATGQLLLAGIAGSAIVLFAVATRLSEAGRIARRLKPLRGQAVYVSVWDRPLPGAAGVALRVESVRAFGAGLLFWLSSGPGKKGTLLKVAQPKEAHIGEGDVEIAGAAYVQWGGSRLSEAKGVPAVVLLVSE